jgi:hypothetical protein
MNAKDEVRFSMAASLLVLFSAMLDPRISVVIAVIFLWIMSFYKVTRTS